MPSDLTEPTLEELSAYVDQELDDAARERVEQHLATCADCRVRLAGLRETAHAIRGLPMESPPRSFSIPKQRARSWTWAPVGWLGAGAAAVLAVVIGIHQFAPTGGATATSTFSNFAPAQERSASKSTGPTAQVPAPAYSMNDHAAGAAASSNQVTIVDPRDGARILNVMTDAKAYPATGRIVITGHVQSDSAVKLDQVRLVLRRGSYGVQLPQPGSTGVSANQMTFEASYSIASLALADPRTGSYTLTVTWTANDGTGATLIAELPITIQ